MGWFMLSGVLIGAAFALGVFIGQWGSWVRTSRIESKVRAVANDAAENRMFDGSATVPVEWVEDRMNWIIAQDFQ